MTEEVHPMSQLHARALRVLLTIPFSLAILKADAKDDETLNKATTVLQEMLSKEDFAPNLAKTKCILVLPEVKKFGIGIGGSSGATASSVGSDILTYGKTSGLFAGVSLGNATIDPDGNGNKRLYGKPITPSEIPVDKGVQTPASGAPLIAL